MPSNSPSARQGSVLVEREGVAVGVAEFDGPAAGRFAHGGEHLHAVRGEGFDGVVDAAVVEPEHDLGGAPDGGFAFEEDELRAAREFPREVALLLAELDPEGLRVKTAGPLQIL